jgi:hypothetical protein
MNWLAQATQVSTSDVNRGYGNLVFMGCFILALIIVGIWWLKRQV